MEIELELKNVFFTKYPIYMQSWKKTKTNIDWIPPNLQQTYKLD